MSISIRAPSGRDATPIVVRAGNGLENWRSYAAFIAAKSDMSTRYTFTFTTSSDASPAAASTPKRFRKHRSDWAAMPPSTSAPVAGSRGVWPER